MNVRIPHRVLFVALLAVTLWLPSPSSAQGIGLPLRSDSHRQWMLALAAGRQQREIGGWPTTARLAYAKASLGLGGKLDVFAGLGLMDLEMQVPGTELSTMSSEPALTYGLGGTLQLIQFRRVGMAIFLSAAAWRSQPELAASLGGEELTTLVRRVHLHYDWREASGAITLWKKLGISEWYIGTGGYLIQRPEKRWTVLETSVSAVKGPVSTGEFRSGFVSRFLAGVDFDLAQGFKISIEVAGRDRDNVNVLVGVSQIGSPP